MSITIDAPHLKKKEENTGWISICIGEGDYRGKGVAHEAMIFFLEEECKALGLKRIELGVFEYNQRARTFYEKKWDTRPSSVLKILFILMVNGMQIYVWKNIYKLFHFFWNFFLNSFRLKDITQCIDYPRVQIM